MRVLIAGCGYIGCELARQLRGRGDEVWVLSRNAGALEQSGVEAARQVQALLHEDAWHRQLEGDWDAVINLVSSAGNGLEGYRVSYIEGNRSLIQWCDQRHVGHYIYSSATSVYPQSDGQWVAEADVPPEEQLSPSGRLLWHAEQLVAGSRPGGAEPLILRLGGIYGPGRHLYLDRILDGAIQLPGDGDGWLNLIYRDDVVGFLLRVMSSTLVGGTYNLVDDQPSRKQEIANWLARRCGKEAPLFDVNLSGPRGERRKAGGKLPNRRISNRRLKERFDWQLPTPDYRVGYEKILRLAGL